MTRVLGVIIATFLVASCGGASDGATEPIVVDEPAGGGEGEPSRPAGELVVGEDACESDADCVPVDCCHAAACVAREHAPSCGDAVCTTECRYGTIDCGGGCLCHEGRCAARLSEAPDLEVQ